MGVLVVEDEMVVAALLEATLIEAGYEVVGPFHTCADGLEAAASGRVDVALLDVRLARGSSFAIADALERRKIPFVLVSGMSRGSIPHRHRERLFLAKPFGTSQLLDAVASLACDVGRGCLKVNIAHLPHARRETC